MSTPLVATMEVKTETSPSYMPGFLRSNPISATISDAYRSFQQKRASLGLTNPGTVDNLAKEVQRDVLCNNYAFTGLRGDISKPFSLSPLFQVSHAFALGERERPYTLAALYGTNKTFLQGNIDNEGNLSTRFNYRLAPSLVSKTAIQLAPGGTGDMAQFEHEYSGNDFTASLKALNPSFLDGGITGIFVGSYMQSITSKLAIGLEGVWQRAGMSQPPDTGMSYCARYKSADWYATAQLQQTTFNATYWRQLSERVEACGDLTLAIQPGGPGGMMAGPPQKEGLATLGVKYAFRMSTFRAQVDSKGKMGFVLEKRLVPAVSMTLAAEIDHPTQQSKLGLGISIEAGGEDLQEPLDGSAGSPNIPF